MDTRDPAGEFLRITERYRQMSDSELLVLVPESPQLTPLAQQALASEVRTRGLKVEDAPEIKTPSEPSPFKSPAAFFEHESSNFSGKAAASSGQDSSGGASTSSSSNDGDSAGDADADPYAEDRELVELCTVWSLADARQVDSLLNRAGIPFFMGPEKATFADAVTSTFANGVSVKIMRIGMPWAAQVMQYYEPLDEPPAKPEPEPTELPVRCPKCQSTEVILDDVVPDPRGAAENSSSKYRWTCDACGEQWEDGGVAREG